MPQIRRSSSSASVCTLHLDMVLCRLVSIGSAATDKRRGSCAVDVESAPADRRWGYTDLPCCSLLRTIAAHVVAFLE
jgi:hypothetical protein